MKTTFHQEGPKLWAFLAPRPDNGGAKSRKHPERWRASLADIF